MESSVSNTQADMFRPPVLRNVATAGAKAIDRSLFARKYPISAAKVFDKKNIGKYRTAFEKSQDILRIERVPSVVNDADGDKCVLLQPAVKPDDESSWSEVLKAAVRTGEAKVIPWELTLGYEYWNYLDIMKSILPENNQDEIPVGFAIVGHVAHLNLREAYLPYKYIIAQVLMDKNPVVRTVINKVDDVGAESVFRTFSYEVLAGPDELNVEIKEEDCTFRFDYSKVYWNSRLNTEHRRLVGMFKAGEVVVDVMAGVGPFAVPAGKKGVFVWANDLNPSSIESMRNAIRSNKVEPFVRAYNVDGHKFIHQATAEVLELAEEGKNTVEIPGKRTKSMSRKAPPPPSTHVTIPSTVSHFVMNLPASALTFLPSYRGIYHGKEHQFEPHTDRKLPMVHVHCFSTKSEDNMKEGYEITGIVNEMLGTSLKFEGNVERSEGDTKNKSQAKGEVKDGEVRVHDVRDVAPLKRMFCASFRIPPEVAFAKPAEEMAKLDAL